jgi:hypothetical protein
MKTCDCCFDYASGPFTCVSIVFAFIYALPGLLWFILAIVSFSKASRCSLWVG